MLLHKALKWLSSLMFVCMVMYPAGAVVAQPTLQLDIEGGTYDLTTETIVASTDPFTLYALLLPDNSNTLDDTYYISAAVTPQTGPAGADLGSFTFNGATIDVTADMVYGIPPIEAVLAADPGDLPSHGMYETYYSEFAFQFSSANTSVPYNSQDNAGAGPSGSGDMYYVAFTVNTSLLAAGNAIHFDLYNSEALNGDIDVTKNAPFSHDAESGVSDGNGGGNGHVPEPGVLSMLGMGLMGLMFLGRRIRGA